MKAKKLRRSGLAVLAAAGLVLGVTACGSDSPGDEEASSGDSRATYTVATDSSFVPFEFEENGEHVGFDIDIINAIADEAGFDVDLRVTNFEGIIPGLQTGSYDIAIAGITITERRAQTIDFSNPYYRSGTRIGVPVDNDDIESLDDLDGRTVATRLGSAPLDYLQENVPGAKALPFEQLDQMYLAVEGGSADAVFYDAPNLDHYISTTGGGNLKAVGDLYEPQYYGIAFAKGNEELVTAVNDGLATIIENGSYVETYQKWFGEEPSWVDELTEEADK